jgi:ankyrin repeat protein
MLFRFSNNSLSAPLTTWATKSVARRLNCFALAALLVVLFLLWLPVRSQYRHESAQEAQRDLFQAVWGNNPERVTELLASGLSANSVDVAGIPLLVTAAEQGNTRVVSILLENGANPNVRGDHNPHATPLHLAAENFDVESIKRLVERQANVNAADDYGRTPLMLAAVNTDRDTVQFLIDHGAAVNLKASDGITALGWVKQLRDSAGNRDRTGSANLREDAGRNFGDSRDYENPMIIKRARERHDAVIELLKSYGAQ